MIIPSYRQASLRPLLSLLLSILAILLLSACGSPSNALEGPAEVVQIARSACISCHGSELQGKMGPETNLQHVGKRLSKEQIARQIRKGGESMPAFESRLTAEEIEGLASWLSGKK
ncbi:c-type cytochrome [Paenibacillus sepulcri]|uniref:c-type cytochrome n=1 Tax=Paenibacillus sepulcri TaxID=359917 RepID=UPI0035E5E595